MTDGTFTQAQRDLAFSQIFGSAPPGGRSARASSMPVRAMSSTGVPQRPMTPVGTMMGGGGAGVGSMAPSMNPRANSLTINSARYRPSYGPSGPGPGVGPHSSVVGGGVPGGGLGTAGINGGGVGVGGHQYLGGSGTINYSAPYAPQDPKYDRSTTLSGRIIPQKQEFPRPVSRKTATTAAAVAASSSENHDDAASMTSTTSTTMSLTSTPSSTPRLSHSSSTTATGGHGNSTGMQPPGKRTPAVYGALLSRVATAFKERINPGDRVKNELTYKNAFTGAEAVTLITFVIKTPDRNLALLLGRALDAQRFFHDVTYEHRLRDSDSEVYQFNEPQSLEEDIIVDVDTHRISHASSIGSAATGSTTTLVDTMGQMQQHGNNNEYHGQPFNHNDHHFNNGYHNTTTTAHMAASNNNNNNSNTTSTNNTIQVNGVFTLLADCYSPTCTRDQLCYSIACPRRLEQQARLNMKPQSVLKRSDSRASLHEDKPQKLWIHSVPKEVADSVDDREKKRQEVICEVIYTERDFVKDMEYLRDFWIKPLGVSNVIPEHRRDEFIRRVFMPAMDVHAVNVRLAEALTKRQLVSAVVKQIGDIFCDHVPNFQPFIAYGANQLYAKYEFEREKSINPAFAKFVDETERLKESRKLELNGYLTKPTTRLARYPLLLEAVLKYTKEDNCDCESIPKAIELIRGFLTKVNVESGKSENRFSLLQLAQTLVFRPGEYVDLKLTDERRQIIFKGTLKKRTDNGDIHVYLLDNTILFVKLKQVNKREQLKVHRKPIPIELLVVAEGDEILPKSRARPPSSLIPAVTNKDRDKDKFSLTFQHLGRRGYELTLYSTTFIQRKKWMENIETQRAALRAAGTAYKTRVLQSRFFGATMRVTCMAPCDGGRKLLFGTDMGIYMCAKIASNGPGGQSEMFGRPKKVIAVQNVSQIDVLEEYTTVVALCDKALYLWPLDCIDSDDSAANARRGKKVVSHVNFYKVGLCLGRLLVCTVKSSSMNSQVKLWEPFDPAPRSKRQTAPLRRLLQQQSEGLKLYTEFPIPSETLSISFLKRRLCIGCAKGFEIVDLSTKETQSLLDPADTSLDFAIRREALKPLSIYRLHSDFLLNYSDFSFFVNSNGWRTRPEWIIHWEGLPQHFALSYPYLVAFEPNFIEIRHMDTAEIVRVITGDNIRFLHESTRELLYVHEDENGLDQIVSLDFWQSTEISDK